MKKDREVWLSILALAFEEKQGLDKVKEALQDCSCEGKWPGEIRLTKNTRILRDETQEECEVRIIPHSSKDDEGRVIKLVVGRNSKHQLNNEFKLVVDYTRKPSLNHFSKIKNLAEKNKKMFISVKYSEIDEEEQEDYLFQGVLLPQV